MREAALRSKVQDLECVPPADAKCTFNHILQPHVLQGQSLAEQAVTDLEQQDNTRLQRSVEAGLASAQARVLPDSGDGSSASTSRAADIEADGSQSAGGVSSANGVSQQSHNDAQSGSSASSSSARPKGSQLSAAEKQKKAVNSVS